MTGAVVRERGVDVFVAFVVSHCMALDVVEKEGERGTI